LIHASNAYLTLGKADEAMGTDVGQMVKSWGNDDESHPPDMKYSTYSPPKCIDPRHSNTEPVFFFFTGVFNIEMHHWMEWSIQFLDKTT